MSVLIGAGVVAVVAAGYVGRKGWLALHRAVGITPGTLKYVPPSQLPPPPMLQLTLAESQIKDLPPVIMERLLRIDAQGRASWLAALVLGDGSGLSRDDWTLLQATGTVHLLVISGQHIGLFAGLIYGFIALLARYGLWPRRLPWLPWACALAFICATGYGVRLIDRYVRDALGG